MCYIAIQLLLFDQHSLQFTSLSHRPKWKNVNEFDPSSVKNRDLEFPYFLTFAKSADASRNVYICIVNAVTSFCGGNTSESIRFFFSIFQTHRVYIYICILSLGPIYHHCLRFPLLYTSLSRERREAIEKKNCISSNPPSASISFAVFLKIVSILKKKLDNIVVVSKLRRSNFNIWFQNMLSILFKQIVIIGKILPNRNTNIRIWVKKITCTKLGYCTLT